LFPVQAADQWVLHVFALNEGFCCYGNNNPCTVPVGHHALAVYGQDTSFNMMASLSLLVAACWF